MPVSSLLESGPAVQLLERERSPSDALMVAILEHLNEQTVISLDTLVCLMPQYTWNQVFHCVDQLTRCNKVILRRHGFEYILFSPHFVA
jgi:hypothetical protein